jgi:hypothetical protein
MAFKMKGNPMQRNFGVGSPMNKKKRYQYTETTEPTTAEKRAFQSDIQGVTTVHSDKDKAKSYIAKSEARRKEGREKDYREGLRKGQRRRYDKAMASGKERKISKKLGKRTKAYIESGMSEDKARQYATQDASRVTKPRRRKK